MLANSKIIDTAKINLDGAYTIVSETKGKFYLQNPVYFFKNGLVFLEDQRTHLDSLPNDEWMRKYFKKYAIIWGTYEIVGDTINACIRYAYNPNFLSYRKTNYQGIIKNKSNIMGWHVTKPYPKLPKYKLKDNLSIFEDTLNLYFKPLSIKSYMDTVSEKAWPNKYGHKRS